MTELQQERNRIADRLTYDIYVGQLRNVINENSERSEHYEAFADMLATVVKSLRGQS